MSSPSGIFKNRTLVLLLGIIALGFALRATRYAIEHRVDKDSVGYIAMAEMAAKGKVNEAIGLNPRMPPLYISLMTLGEYSGLGAETAGVIVSMLAGTFILIPVFLIARKIFGDKTGLVSAFLVATHPYLIRLSTEVMRDSLFIFLTFGAIAFAIHAAEHPGISWKWYLVGAFAGLAAMTRSEGSFLIAVIVLWSLLETAFLAKGALASFLKRTAGLFICVLAGFLLLVVPVQIILSDTPSRWSIIDYRIPDAIRTFTSMSKKEILEKEDR